MVPVQKLLARILWDGDFGQGSFEIGYLDHLEARIIRVPLQEIIFEEGNHFSFQLQDAGGNIRTIPFHRIREVYKDNALIWKRPP
jgi:uncharacterized protein (UPF0248 family)